jgi:HEAT repeat protein
MKRAISVLEETINNGSALGRSVAADALAAIGPDAKTAAPALRTVLQSQRGSAFAPGVAFALWKTSHDPLGISALAEMLAENQLAPYSATHLGDIGPPAKSAVPALGRAMRRQDRFVAVYAARALWLVDKQDLALSNLCGWLKKEDSLTRHYCCLFLADIGPCPRSVLALKNALEDRDDFVRWTAREVLRKWNID